MLHLLNLHCQHRRETCAQRGFLKNAACLAHSGRSREYPPPSDHTVHQNLCGLETKPGIQTSIRTESHLRYSYVTLLAGCMNRRRLVQLCVERLHSRTWDLVRMQHVWQFKSANNTPQSHSAPPFCLACLACLPCSAQARSPNHAKPLTTDMTILHWDSSCVVAVRPTTPIDASCDGCHARMCLTT